MNNRQSRIYAKPEMVFSLVTAEDLNISESGLLVHSKSLSLASLLLMTIKNMLICL